MAKKINWGKNNKCGVIGCNEQVGWGEFTSYLACENHRNRKWGLCEACRTKKTTHTVYYDIFHGESNAETEAKVKEKISFLKEIIEQLFNQNISNSLREKLNGAHQKLQVAEKNVLELERLTTEYWETKLNSAGNFISEKGGQQTNIFESNLCDDCGDEVDNRQQKLKSDYEVKVLNKLMVLDSETVVQINKEIGEKKFSNMAVDTAVKEGLGEGAELVRWRFLTSGLSFFQDKKIAEQKPKKKTFFQKLHQYFQENSIRQIVESGGDNYIIWYANGNIEEKRSSQLTEWRKLRTYFFNTSVKNISLHDINSILKSLENEPIPKEEEKESPVEKNNEKEKGSFSELEKELIKSFFLQNGIQKIELVKGELVITYNNNNEVKNQLQISEDPKMEYISNLLQKNDRKTLTFSELSNSDNSHNSPSPQSKNDYVPYLIGGSAGILITLIVIISYRLSKKSSKKNIE